MQAPVTENTRIGPLLPQKLQAHGFPNMRKSDVKHTTVELEVAWPTDELEGDQLGGQHEIANDSGFDGGGGDEGNTNCPSNNPNSILIIYVLLQSIIPRGNL